MDRKLAAQAETLERCAGLEHADEAIANHRRVPPGDRHGRTTEGSRAIRRIAVIGAAAIAGAILGVAIAQMTIRQPWT